MRYLVLFILLFAINSVFGQQIPKKGTDTTLDIANWNLEWFGHAFNGPSNDSVQIENARKIILAADMDLWGLCEISDASAWDTLLAGLTNYGSTISTWSQTQKTALLYKKSIFRLLYSKNILEIYEQEFASGRLPLEVALEANMGTWKDTIYAYVVHLKANIGTTAEKADAWARRKQSSEALKAYIEASGKWKKSIVLGDWNDDVDTSVLDGYATPFSKFVKDTFFFFPSMSLSIAGEKSTAKYSELIDHQCVTKRLQNDFVAASCEVFYLDSIVLNYAASTSDHYPVFSRYVLHQPVPTNAVSQPLLPRGYWINGRVQFSNCTQAPDYELFDLLGRKRDSAVAGEIYMLRFQYQGTFYLQKIWVPLN